MTLSSFLSTPSSTSSSSLDSTLCFSSSLLLPSPSACHPFFVFSFSLLCSPPVCLSQHTVCIHSTVKSTFICTVALATSISVGIFSESYKHVCWLIHGARCPEPWSLDEVTSICLETFYRCNAFQDLHNWWVHDEWLHLRESPRLTPATMKPHRNPTYDTIEHKNRSKHSLYCNQILRKQHRRAHIQFECTQQTSTSSQNLKCWIFFFVRCRMFFFADGDNYNVSWLANELWASGPCDYHSVWLRLISQTQQLWHTYIHRHTHITKYVFPAF